MNEQEWRQRLRALDRYPLPDKHALLARVTAAARAETPRPRKRIRMRILLAACLTVALLCSLTVFAVATEQMEYREALSFFEQHRLSTEGYSRRDIKLIYRDIVSGSFAEDETVEMTITVVGGYDISTDDITPELIRSLWEKKLAKDEINEQSVRDGFSVDGAVAPTGVSYRFKNQVRYAQTLEETYVMLECYRDGALAWSRTYPSISVTDLAYTDGYIAITGRALLPNDAGVIEDRSALTLLDTEGNVICRTALTSPAVAIFADGDGITLISSDTSSITIARYDPDGKRARHIQRSFSTMGLKIVKEFVDSDGRDAIGIIYSNYTVKDVCRLGSEYILHLQEWQTASELIVRIDEHANLLGEFRFYTDGQTYRFADVAVCGDTLYLSGYAIPETEVAPYDELKGLKQRLLGGEQTDDARLTAAVREYYTAVLLKCDATTGKTSAFYSVEGALGDTFSLDANGDLVWRVNEIGSATHAVSAWAGHAPNAIHIKGIGPVLAYTVSPEGILLGDRMTDEVAEFTR